VAVLVDLYDEAPRISAACKPAHAFRAAEDDRVCIGPPLDREPFGKLFVKEGIEAVLARARRIDPAAHLTDQYERNAFTLIRLP
jgi:hypothetical protein